MTPQELEILQKQYDQIENDLGAAIKKTDNEVEAEVINGLSSGELNSTPAVDAINEHLVKSARLIKSLEARKISKEEVDRRLAELRKSDLLPILRAVQQTAKEQEGLIQKFDEKFQSLKAQNQSSILQTLTPEAVSKMLSVIQKGEAEYSTVNIHEAAVNESVLYKTDNVGLKKADSVRVNVSQDRIDSHPLGPLTVVSSMIYSKLLEFGDIMPLIPAEDIGNAEKWVYPFTVGHGTTESGTERGDFTQTDLPGFGTREFSAYPLRWFVVVTEKMMRNWPGLPSWIINQAAKYMYIYMNYHMLLGDGINKPFGMLTYADEGKKIRRYGTGVADKLFADYFDYHNVIAEMKAGHWKNARIMVSNRTWWLVIGKYLDANGHPYVLPKDYNMFGQPVVINPDMPEEGSGTSPMIIFNPDVTYLRVYNSWQRMGTLREKAFPHTAFYGESYNGGGVLDAEAAIILQCNAVKGILNEFEIIA